MSMPLTYGLGLMPTHILPEGHPVMRDLDARPHPLDQMCFLWRTSKRLVCMAIFHVDDMLVAWDLDKFEIGTVRNSFQWGSWSDICNGDISYLGKAISIKDGQLIMHSRVYLSNPGRSLEVDRRQGQAIPPEELFTLQNPVRGNAVIVWCTRPDLASGTSLLQSGAPTIEDYQNLCEHLNYAKQTDQAGIVFHAVDLHTPFLVGYGDSPFANAEGKRSQAGLLCGANLNGCHAV